MTDDKQIQPGDERPDGEGEADAARKLSPAAMRALAEAELRRKAAEARPATTPRELGGQSGPDPVRYGDWEKGGIVSDF